MTELKTLKDIRTEVDIKTEELDLITELRAEAIKWITNWAQFEEKYAISAEQAFKEFFNISEEDLK